MSDAVIRKSPAADTKFPVARTHIIGVDLDNVCFPHTRELRPFAAEWIAAHKRPAGTTPADVLDDLVEDAGWFAPEWNITPDEFFAIERYAIERGFFRNAEPIEGASETLQALAQAGYTIRYVTARPQYRDAAQQTRDSLARHGFPNPEDVLFVGEHFGSHLKSMLNYALYIDDSVSNIRDFEATGIPHIVFDQVYNRELGDDHRARSWSEVPELVDALLGRTVIPPDRSRALHEAEDLCDSLGKKAILLADQIAELTETRSALLRQHKRREAKAVKVQIDERERELVRVRERLEQAEGRRQSLHRDVQRFDEHVRHNPEHMRDPKLKESLRLRDEIREERCKLEAERAEFDRQRAAAPTDDAVLIEPGEPHQTPREIISYGPYIQVIPEGGQLLDALAMMVARVHVEESWNHKVIASRVMVRLDDKTTTDIDLLVVRTDKDAEIEQRAQLLQELGQLFPADPRHADTARAIRALEREIFIAVEVKSGLGNLSAAQKALHRRLSSGGTTTIASKDTSISPEADRFGLATGTVIAATPSMVNVTSTDVISLASKNRKLQGDLDELRAQLEADPAFAETNPASDDLAPAAIQDRAKADSGRLLDLGRPFGPINKPTTN